MGITELVLGDAFLYPSPQSKIRLLFFAFLDFLVLFCGLYAKVETPLPCYAKYAHVG
jgi:hypothetical protein